MAPLGKCRLQLDMNRFSSRGDEGKQNRVCLDDHHHGAETEPAAICTTVAILDDDSNPDRPA